MIGAIRGKLVLRQPPDLLVEAGGLCYELQVPLSIFDSLPEQGAEVFLFTHLVSREDSTSLYAFASQRERDLFRMLIRVSGVGPRLGLAVLSGMSIDELVHCLLENEVQRLVRVPGIGRRTAERLVLEMRGKLEGSELLPVAVSASDAAQRDAVRALETLGYSRREATKAAADAARELPEGNSEQLIREALRRLAR